MSWLRPDSGSPSDYDPEVRFAEMISRLGPLSEKIAHTFNDVDPLHVFYGNNPDEYVGYVERLFSALEGRDFSTLSDQDLSGLVRGSFHQSQIEQGFLTAEDLQVLIQKMIDLRNEKSE